jgi:hypothetical protein
MTLVALRSVEEREAAQVAGGQSAIIVTSAGEVLCGQLGPVAGGLLQLQVAADRSPIPLPSVASVLLVESCPAVPMPSASSSIAPAP